jgi:hypothetical protein
MKNYILNSIILSCFILAFNVEAFPKLPNVPGMPEIPKIPGMPGASEETEDKSSMDPAAAAEKLESEMRAVLFDIAEAEVLIKEAYGDKSGAEKAKIRAENINKGAGIKDVIEETMSSAEETAKLASENKELGDEAKKNLTKAIPPYLKAVYRTSQLSGPIKDFADEAKSALSEVKTNPMKFRKLQKSLSTGMTIAKNGPGLIKGLVSNGKDLATSAKSQGVEVDDSDISGAI